MLILNQLRRADKALWSVAVIVVAGMGILLAGLWYLQVVSSHRYVERQNTQSFRTVRVPALRGNIFDRNGFAMAKNKPSYNINLYLEELRSLFQAEYRRAVAARKRLSRAARSELGKETRYLAASKVVQDLGMILQQPLNLDKESFFEHYDNRLVLPLPIVEDLNRHQIALFQENPNRPPGLILEIQPLRVYTNGALAAHILGHLQRTYDFDFGEDIDFFYPLPDFVGKVGVEGAFDRELRGRAGAKAVLVNNMGYRQSENTWLPAEPGHNLFLTIDLNIQKAAESALASAGNPAKGAAVVMDAHSGDILALASSPGYDPNLFVPRITHADWQRLCDPQLETLINRATYGAYMPGSIFKIVVALAGLESGEIRPEEVYYSKGYYQLGRTVFSDTAPSGEYNFRRAFKLSSNSYFIHYGLKAGLANIVDMGERFFLGKKADVPLLQERSGFFPTREWIKTRSEHGEPIQPGDIANLCIGQGYLTVTPLQMAVMTAAVANGGKVLQPRLVMRIAPQAPGNEDVVQELPSHQVRGDLRVSPRNLALIRQVMLADVEEPDGTGRKAAVTGMRICGKTGTAQVASGRTMSRKDTWFVSFAPYENPRYVVVILVVDGVSGGTTCAPLAHHIYQAIKNLESQRRPQISTLAQASHSQ